MPSVRRLVPALLLVAACSSEDSASTGDKASEAKESAEVAGASVCRVDAVHALAQTLAEGSVAERQAQVSEGLTAACDLPKAYTAFLSATEPGAKADARVEASKQHPELLEGLCSDPKAVVASTADAKARERAEVFYDQCGLGAHGVAERGSWLRRGPTSVVPFAAKGWLESQGVDAADALVVAKALVLRDRTRWSGAGQVLSVVDTALSPVPSDSVSVHITANEIRVGGVRVVGLKDGQLASAEKVNDEHPDEKALREALLAEREALPDDVEVTLAVAADATVPALTVARVAEMTRAAKLSGVALVGTSKTTGEGMLPFSATRLPSSMLTVAIDDKGFKLSTLGEKTSERIGMPYDFERLNARVSRAVKGKEGEAPVVIEFADSVPTSVVTSVLALLGPARCEGVTTDCTSLQLELRSQSLSKKLRHDDIAAMARHAGVLGSLKAESGAFLASPYGGAFAVGGDDEDVWGGLTGTEVGEAYGVGGLGLVGTGRGGGGSGEGTVGGLGLMGKGGGGGSGFGSRKVPKVRQAPATVTGSLDKDIIRRIVRAHINEVRQCYSKELKTNPTAKGRVAISFVIGDNGKVTTSKLDKEDVGGKVGTCVASAAKRWKFPKPHDGTVLVKYPFTFEPG